MCDRLRIRAAKRLCFAARAIFRDRGEFNIFSHLNFEAAEPFLARLRHAGSPSGAEPDVRFRANLVEKLGIGPQQHRDMGWSENILLLICPEINKIAGSHRPR
jgi:hypothetical protein